MKTCTTENPFQSTSKTSPYIQQFFNLELKLIESVIVKRFSDSNEWLRMKQNYSNDIIHKFPDASPQMAVPGLKTSLLVVLVLVVLSPQSAAAMNCSTFCSDRFSVCVYVRQCFGGIMPSTFFLCQLRCYDLMQQCRERCQIILEHGPLRKL